MSHINYNSPIHVHFIGIGGISMSGLADILFSKGFTISGSDSKESELTRNLISQGIKVFIGQKADNITAWLVPGSWNVDRQIREEGIDKIVEEAGFEIRQPGCSACLAMNDDKIPAGKYSVSTSNRNFEGRQGPVSRTILASPLVAAAAAVTGKLTDPRDLM